MNPTRLTLAALLLAMSALPAAAAPAKPKLAEGDPAPAVRFDEFLKGEAIQALDPEGTYVIEFWAVNCSCCPEAMSHLTQVARELGDKAVFVSVAVWNEDAQEVRAFVKKQGDKMGVRVVRDKDGFMQKNWLEASGQTGIPWAVAVVKGKVVFIGPPLDLDAKLITGLRDGTFTAKDLAQRREQDAACGREFRASGQLPVRTDAARREAIEMLRKLAVKYPKAAYPAFFIRHYEKELAKD